MKDKLFVLMGHFVSYLLKQISNLAQSSIDFFPFNVLMLRRAKPQTADARNVPLVCLNLKHTAHQKPLVSQLPSKCVVLEVALFLFAGSGLLLA